jgi:hypothetical protein
LRTYVTILWSFEEQDVIFDIHEDIKLGWEEIQGIPNIGIEDSHKKKIVEQSKVLKIW